MTAGLAAVVFGYLRNENFYFLTSVFIKLVSLKWFHKTRAFLNLYYSVVVIRYFFFFSPEPEKVKPAWVRSKCSLSSGLPFIVNVNLFKPLI